MASFSWRQWTAITGGAILFTSLFFINRKPPKAETTTPQANGHTVQAVSIDSIFNQAEVQVPALVRERLNNIKGALSGSSPDAQFKLLTSIVRLYDSVGAQLPATFYIEKMAALQNSSDLWCRAGDNYYKCAEIVNPNARDPLLKRAITCYNSALSADSANIDAKIGKGECIVQGGGNPMEGIMMIEGVLKKDSNNEKAQIALGAFSIQSGQFPKAISRFKKVLKIDPSYIEAYLYLAQAYENSGDKSSAVLNLEKYNTFATDSAIKIQVNNYIKKLENDTTGQNNK